MDLSLEYITNYINAKLAEDDGRIVITFYELVMKENLNRDQVNKFLELSRIRLTNMGYKIYVTGDTYEYKGERHLIENNVFFVAIRENK